tara:strand:+ start:126 stop:446 length:321 start_codon:yes stop_codon:yes gene_type:complete
VVLEVQAVLVKHTVDHHRVQEEAVVQAQLQMYRVQLFTTLVAEEAVALTTFLQVAEIVVADRDRVEQQTKAQDQRERQILVAVVVVKVLNLASVLMVDHMEAELVL